MFEKERESWNVDGALILCAVSITDGVSAGGGGNSWVGGGTGLRLARGPSEYAAYGNGPPWDDAAEAGVFGSFGDRLSSRSSYSPHISSSPSGAFKSGMSAVGTINGMNPELLDPVDSSEFLRGGKDKNSDEVLETVGTRESLASSASVGGDAVRFWFRASMPVELDIVTFGPSADRRFKMFPIELLVAGDGCAGPKGLENDVSDSFRSRSLLETTCGILPTCCSRLGLGWSCDRLGISAFCSGADAGDTSSSIGDTSTRAEDIG